MAMKQENILPDQSLLASVARDGKEDRDFALKIVRATQSSVKNPQQMLAELYKGSGGIFQTRVMSR